MPSPHDDEIARWRDFATRRQSERVGSQQPWDVQLARSKATPPPPERIVEPVDGDEVMPDYEGEE